MANMTKRIDELEKRALNDDVRPALVQIIGPDGPLVGQLADEELATKQGMEVIRIEFKDASRAAINAEEAIAANPA